MTDDELYRLLEQGNSLFEGGDFKGASLAYEVSLKILEARDSSGDADQLVLAAVLSHRLGVLHLAIGEPRSAAENWAHSISAATRAEALDPETTSSVSQNIVNRT